MKIKLRTILSISLISMVSIVSAKETAHVIVKAKEGSSPYELVIHEIKTDPRYGEIRTRLENGIFETDITTDFIEKYYIVDFGEIMEKGFTSRGNSFMIEDGAVITLTLDGDEFLVESTGKEQNAVERMSNILDEKFSERHLALDSISDTKQAQRLFKQLLKDENSFTDQYLIENPMIDFLLSLENKMERPMFNDHSLQSDLKLYHEHYADLYPGHPAHENIAKSENFGYQLYGGKYHDYEIRTIDGDKVKASDYLKPGYNLVIGWATWCKPCRKECQDINAFIKPYMDAGLGVFAITREQKNTDALRKALEEDNYPWPTLVDLDDEFQVFRHHGATSSAVFLINPEGDIIFADFQLDSLKELLDEIYPSVK